MAKPIVLSNFDPCFHIQDLDDFDLDAIKLEEKNVPELSITGEGRSKCYLVIKLSVNG